MISDVSCAPSRCWRARSACQEECGAGRSGIPAAAALIAVIVLALAGGLAATLHVNRTLAGGKQSVESALTEKSAALDGQTRALIDALLSRAESAARLTGQAGQRTAALDAVRRGRQPYR